MRVAALALLVVVLASSGCESIRAFRERNRLRTFQPWEVVPLEHAGWEGQGYDRDLWQDRNSRYWGDRRPIDGFKWIDQF